MTAFALIALVFIGFTGFQSETAPASVGAAFEQATSTENQSPPAENISSRPLYRVLKVVDGDTLAIDMDGKSTTLRLIGLDTPETSDPRKPVQCFGIEASNKAKELLANASISIERDPTQDTYDKYGRLLVYVYLSDGTLFNEYMIREGYGHEYTYRDSYRYQAQFKAAEQSARSEKKGLWAPNACANSSQSSATSPAPVTPGTYDCSKNTYNCTSFKTQAEAQNAFDSCGGNANDVHKLDSDKDGRVCESLP